MSPRVIEREKKARALNPGTFGCLKGAYTVNVTQGYAPSCTYCYARGYTSAPPKGDVLLFVNIPGLLRSELDSRSRRRLPHAVTLKTATDCFQPHPDILEVTHQAMALLLERSIAISFLTKGSIPRRFIELFKAYRENVQAQVGLVSLSESYWRNYEPGAASPRERLDNIEGLLSAGIETQVRVAPIIPVVTDTPGEGESLFRALERKRV